MKDFALTIGIGSSNIVKLSWKNAQFKNVSVKSQKLSVYVRNAYKKDLKKSMNKRILIGLLILI